MKISRVKTVEDEKVGIVEYHHSRMVVMSNNKVKYGRLIMQDHLITEDQSSKVSNTHEEALSQVP